MRTSQVYLKVRQLREKMNDPLTLAELELVGKSKKEPKWINDIRQASRPLVDDKRMQKVGHGVWKFTEKGLKWLEHSGWLVDPIDDLDDSDE